MGVISQIRIDIEPTVAMVCFSENTVEAITR